MVMGAEQAMNRRNTKEHTLMENLCFFCDLVTVSPSCHYGSLLTDCVCLIRLADAAHCMFKFKITSYTLTPIKCY